MEKKVYSIAEFAEALGVSKSTGKAVIARGDVRAVRVGRRVLVPVAELERFLSERTEAAQ